MLDRQRVFREGDNAFQIVNQTIEALKQVEVEEKLFIEEMLPLVTDFKRPEKYCITLPI